MYAWRMPEVIQVPCWPGRGALAQAVITCSNAVSARTSHGLCRRPRRKREDRRTPSVANTMRGSGDHHSGGWPGENQGKMP